MKKVRVKNIDLRQERERFKLEKRKKTGFKANIINIA